ncbi:Crp/Fnr family transcriptional regulator [Actibacterium ureilyticum]|uniref:Crp/Fnr family transcriptional regulator n=1 Tax=Actibacterium ureilyticum TaxID=1590614 RepID=UPI000BAB22DB|nr:Crp/Fnr family transcriptional regulator [Actibacterium ureilyticum]
MHKTACTDCPLRDCSLFDRLTQSELEFMLSFKSGEMQAQPGTTILLEGSSSPQLYTVLQGMGTRYVTLEDGQRQVINFAFPGDFIGLQASLMGEMKHSVEATTDMVLCIFRREDLWSLFRAHPDRAYDLTWIAAAEEHFLGETIATLGRRDAIQRIAWALLRMYQRLRALGLARGGSVPLPFRQQDLADALGLSLVHTNKTLSKLRERELVRWTDGMLTLFDKSALAQIAMTELEPAVTRPLI